MTDESHSTDRVAAYPEHLPLLMLMDQVVFPGSAVPLRVAAAQEKELINEVAKGDKLLAMVTMKRAPANGFERSDAYDVGCIGRLLQVQQLPDGSYTIIVQTLQRFRIANLVRHDGYPVISIEPLESIQGKARDIKPLVAALKTQASELISLSPNIPDGAAAIVDNISDPAFLTDLVAGNLNVALEEKQRILSTLDLRERLEHLIYLMEREIDVMRVSNKIQRDVKSSIDRGQREYYLRQQLRAIQEELGEGGERRPEVQEYREKIGALKLPEEVLKEVERELDRFAHMPEASAEYHVVTTYLDWIVELPWNESTEDRLDIDRAEKILNEDHYGLEKVKRRILEYLAVLKLKKKTGGAILCFAGPLGVGKTSLGKSIARALGRKFVRLSLGGVRDEAEIRGHRKTYVGALPGRIIQSMRKAGSNNPVMMLDEIDKLGADFRGDPGSALLEVLDPAQNDTFTDHYLGVPFDLSKVMFIATANVLDTIPWALRDRMETIEIPGYTIEEKIEIAHKYLVPRQLDAHGIKKRDLKITKPALRAIVEQYTREAGVRNLEREIATICRVSAMRFVRPNAEAITIGPSELKEFLGNPRIYVDMAERVSIPGVATGLAWTATGGDILFIEATRMPGKGNLVLTGQLGEVMRESATAVMSYIRANAARYGIDPQTFSESDVHVHVPHGAVPKDGPSAGVAILTAVTSLLTGRKVKDQLAMTGEITLRGMVLPVGGIKEKVLAAVRSGIREIILPERCKNDLDDVPPTAKDRVRFHFVSRMDDVLRIALGLKG